MSANVALCTCNINIEQLIKVVKNDNKARRKKKRKPGKKRKRGTLKPTCLTEIRRRFSLFSVFMCI
jgi:hypothetical protein